MFNRGVLTFLIGGVFYTLMALSLFTRVNALTVQAREIVLSVNENGFISFDEEMEQNDCQVLSDRTRFISSVNDEMEDTENYSEDLSGDNSDSETESEEDMTNNDKFEIMIVFCFGLCAGVIVGHFLTGFIK